MFRQPARIELFSDVFILLERLTDDNVHEKYEVDGLVVSHIGPDPKVEIESLLRLEWGNTTLVRSAFTEKVLIGLISEKIQKHWDNYVPFEITIGSVTLHHHTNSVALTDDTEELSETPKTATHSPPNASLLWTSTASIRNLVIALDPPLEEGCRATYAGDRIFDLRVHLGRTFPHGTMARWSGSHFEAVVFSRLVAELKEPNTKKWTTFHLVQDGQALEAQHHYRVFSEQGSVVQTSSVLYRQDPQLTQVNLRYAPESIAGRQILEAIEFLGDGDPQNITFSRPAVVAN